MFEPSLSCRRRPHQVSTISAYEAYSAITHAAVRFEALTSKNGGQ